MFSDCALDVHQAAEKQRHSAALFMDTASAPSARYKDRALIYLNAVIAKTTSPSARVLLFSSALRTKAIIFASNPPAYKPTRRQFPNYWRSITRLACRRSAIKRSAVPPVGVGGADHWFGRGRMSRDDLFLWLSLIWLVALCGVAAWVFAAVPF